MTKPIDPAIFVETFAPTGPGPTIAIKDCIAVAGNVTGCGSAAFAGDPPATEHAAVVAALLRAGWQVTAKANMHELAFGMTGINAYTGTPVNPKFPDRIVGGSSSGCAAAVAAGLVDAAIGSDTGGSIRLPAACCGVIGLKPTFGAISREGAQPVTSSLDALGPFARDMATIVRVMEAICPDFAVPGPQTPIRFARVECDAQPAIAQALGDALAALSPAAIAPVPQPIVLPSLAAAQPAGITIMAHEMAALFGHLVGSGKLGADIDARLAAGKTVSSQAVAEAEAVRTRFTAEVDAALETCDVLVLPTLPDVPLRVAEATDAPAALRLSALVRPFNLSGHPALTLPVTTREGLPAGVQLIARKGADALLCRAGLLFEAAHTAR